MVTPFQLKTSEDHKQPAIQLEAEAAASDMLARPAHCPEMRAKSGQKAVRADDLLKRLTERRDP
ncbi:hypothetical protein [Bradyrhizobium sp. NFR13]|uniref:hypothetical protein n=1 Tax=Bradyrhizobium sp. NFR13 TaxID=1566285 RepID=UPI000B88CD5E|nr:hypothetical protein [Bradyrhizobium sp. NFR13]